MAGETYRLSFDVRSSHSGQIRTNVMQNHTPWQNLGFRTAIDVGRDWQRHSFDFVASGTDSEARLTFIIGGEGPRTPVGPGAHRLQGTATERDCE